MSFKFKLGEVVVPSPDLGFHEEDLPVGPSEVIGIQLNDYIRVQVVGSSRQLLVRAEDYEVFEDKTIPVMD